MRDKTEKLGTGTHSTRISITSVHTAGNRNLFRRISQRKIQRTGHILRHNASYWQFCVMVWLATWHNSSRTKETSNADDLMHRRWDYKDMNTDYRAIDGSGAIKAAEQQNTSEKESSRLLKNCKKRTIFDSRADLHCVSKKRPTLKLSVALSNLNRFSKFLHRWKAYKIRYESST